MPLISICDGLRRARREGYAIPLFDTNDMQCTEGILAAFEEKHACGIVALYAGAFDRPNVRALANYIYARAEDSSVPVSLMLDHGRSREDCRRAMELGFTDVMFDGSRLPLEENIATTHAVVKEAHAAGVSVEGELGHVGAGSEYQTYGALGKGFTDPAAAERFVAETGIDFLAIAIGTAHGTYDGEPAIDTDLLAEISSRVDVPLVLHGGSGLGEEQFRASIARGIAKINIATDIFRAAGERVAQYAGAGERSYHALSRAATEAVTARCGEYIELFGAAGTASG